MRRFADSHRQEHWLILLFSQAEDDDAINSDNMDEPESPQPAKSKRKLGKKALEKLKASQKAKAKKRGDVDSDDDSDDDEYTALSKSLKANAATPSVRPPVGTLEVCTKCEKEFSVVCHLALLLGFCSEHLCRRGILLQRYLHLASYAIHVRRKLDWILSKSPLHRERERCQRTRGRLQALKKNDSPRLLHCASR